MMKSSHCLVEVEGLDDIVVEVFVLGWREHQISWYL